MTINKVLTPFALVAGLALSAAPALAQHRGGGRSEGHAQARSYSGSAYRGGNVYHGAPRGYAAPRGYYGRSYYVAPYYAHPYYAFRPHVSVGFGLWLGYPVAYPYYAAPYPAYGYPYPSAPYSASPYPYPSSSYPSYPPSDPYGYQNGSSYGAPPPSVVPRNSQPSDRGGISFQITPQEAEIFVDGNYVGTAGEFGPSNRPLDLSTGRHRIEVRAQGYRDISFDADVRPGQVLPYQGNLQQD